MKWKLKALAAAIALAVSAPASAAIATSGSGNGELFFSAWDSVTETSYTRDLGYTLSQFVTQVGTFGTSAGGALGGGPLAFAADTVLTNWLGGLSGASLAGLQWNVAAMDGSGQNRYLTTAGGAVSAPTTNGQLQQLNDNADVYITNVNSGPYVNGTHAGALTNGSSVISAGGATANPSGYAGSGVWGSNFGGKVTFSNAGGVGDDLNFFVLYALGSLTLSGVGTDQFDGAWNFASDGDLTYNVAAVPVPAAVWLLGSGLLGLAGIARRRQLKLA